MPTTYWAFPTQTFTAWDANGDPVASAEAKYFEAGTSTPLTVYTDTALSTPHAVPQVADGNGVFAPSYISGADEIKIEVRTPAGALLPGYPVDNITGTPVGGLAASGIVFAPTATLAAVEVQAALETLDSITSRLPETVTAGSSDAYTLDPPLTITAYTDGMIFVLRADRDSTGAATLNVDTVGAKDWKRHDGSSYAAYGADGIRVGNHYWVEYDSGADEFRTVFVSGPSATFTGDVSVAGEVQLDGVVQTPADVFTSSSNAVALVMTGGSKKTLTLDETTTITVSAEVADQIVELWITQGSTGGTAAWSGVDKWLDGSAPTLSTTTGEIDIIILSSASDGTTIIAQHLGVAS